MLFVLYLVLVASLTKIECGIPIPTSNYDLLNTLACQIASISSARVTFVYLEHSDEELIRCLSSSHLPVVTLTFDSIGVEKTRNFSSMHILTVDGDVSRRHMQIKGMLDPRIRQKHLSKYLVIFRVPCVGHLERFFNLFWENGILNVVALCCHQRIFTYEPFTSDGFQIVRLPPTIDSSMLFYDKLRNLHHYQLKISQFYNPMRSLPLANNTVFRGIDGLLAMTIVERLNATVRFVLPGIDELYGYDHNGTLTGALRDVATGVTHIGFNARNIDQRYAEYLQPVGKEVVIYLVVPKAPIAPQYLNFIRVFDHFTWLILLITFFLVGAIFACMQQIVLMLPLSRDYVKFRFWNIAEMLFKTAIGDPVDGFHRISSLRQFLIAWILFCYVISSIYFAKMESIFVHPEYEKDIDSLSELPTRLKAPIYGNPNLLKIVEPSVDPKIFQFILSMSRPLPDEYEALVHKLVKMSHDSAFILRRDRANKLIARTFNNENKRPTYHLVREYLMAVLYSYMVTNGSPFLDKFQILHFWCFEHGLLNHFEAGELHIQNIHNDNYPTDEDDDDEDENLSDGLKKKKRVIALDMNILQGAFYSWIIGMGLGCLGFLAELSHWKWHRNEQLTDFELCNEQEDETIL